MSRGPLLAGQLCGEGETEEPLETSLREGRAEVGEKGCGTPCHPQEAQGSGDLSPLHVNPVTHIRIHPGLCYGEESIAVATIGLGALGAADPWRGLLVLGVFPWGSRNKGRWRELRRGEQGGEVTLGHTYEAGARGGGTKLLSASHCSRHPQHLLNLPRPLQ